MIETEFRPCQEIYGPNPYPIKPKTVKPECLYVTNTIASKDITEIKNKNESFQGKSWDQTKLQSMNLHLV